MKYLLIALTCMLVFACNNRKGSETESGTTQKDSTSSPNEQAVNKTYSNRMTVTKSKKLTSELLHINADQLGYITEEYLNSPAPLVEPKQQADVRYGHSLAFGFSPQMNKRVYIITSVDFGMAGSPKGCCGGTSEVWFPMDSWDFFNTGQICTKVPGQENVQKAIVELRPKTK
jgi:hypothetical protein